MAARNGTTRKSTTPKKATTRRKAAAPARSAKPSATTAALAVGALAAGVAGLVTLFRRGSLDALLGRGNAEHPAPDLEGDSHPDGSQRAPVDFRPDPTAPVPAGERDAMRPALAGAAAPTLVRGQARELERLDASPS